MESYNQSDIQQGQPQDDSDLDIVRQLLASHLIDGKNASLYTLVKWLQQPEQAIFNADALKDSLLLFRCNFLIMHSLYQLRNQWRSQGVGELFISALHIQLLPFSTDEGVADQSESREIENADPLQAYYLNLDNLTTSREEIERLLEQFWKKMAQPDYRIHQDQDLLELELTPPVSAREIRQQYRRLAMKHHPDRGGDSLKFRQISAAFQRLKQAPFYR